MSEDLVVDRSDLVARVVRWRGQATKEKTIRNWVGFPWPPRYPAPFGPIEEWLEANAPRPKRAAAPTDASEVALRMRLLQEQIRNLEGRNAVLEGTRLDAEEVRRDIITCVNDLQTALMVDAPIRVWEACHDQPTDLFVDRFKQVMREILNEHAARPLADQFGTPAPNA